MKTLIPILISLLVVGCGENQSTNTNESNNTPKKTARTAVQTEANAELKQREEAPIVATEVEEKGSIAESDTNAAHFAKFCMDCHDEDSQKGGLDLYASLSKPETDWTLPFENLITGRMPPAKKTQPSATERDAMLNYLASRQPKRESKRYRRLSRHEFMNSVNDLVGVELDLREKLPEDRDTHVYDSSSEILLTKDLLAANFDVADEVLDYAFPVKGFGEQQTWTCNVIQRTNLQRFSRRHLDGTLFSCFRQKNSAFFPYFYKGFVSPVTGEYQLSVNAQKLGTFDGDVALMVFAGHFYGEPTQTTPKRLLSIFSVDAKMRLHTTKALLNAGEEIAVFCYSPHTMQKPQNNNKEAIGTYIEQLSIKGPVHSSWPPPAYKQRFTGLSMQTAVMAGHRVIGVESTSPIGDLKQAIKTFAERAFCTSLTDGEVLRYHQLSVAEFRSSGDFVTAAKAGMKAILCSPRFLLHPGFRANNSYDSAAKLAHILWLSVADEPLMALAQRDELKGKRLELEVERMLVDDKSQRMIQSFCAQWLELRHFDESSPSTKMYPQYDDVANHYLPLETEAYLAWSIQHNLPVSTLVDSDFSILNQRLARHYGIEGVSGHDMRRVELPADSPRGGLLTMGSILKSTSDGFVTSPILRGAWISKNIVGTTLSPPPPNVEAIKAKTEAGQEAMTIQQQLAEHKRNTSCNACHRSIDPYGLALESFDPSGRWRDKYRVALPHQNTFIWRAKGLFKETATVDPSGDLYGNPFRDISELKQILVAAPEKLAYNLSKQFFHYANGYEADLRQRIDLHRLVTSGDADMGLRDILRETIIYSIQQKP